MNKKSLFISIVIILILFAATLLTGCTDGKTKDDSNDSGDVGNGDTTDSGFISAKEAWEKVKTAVETWDADYSIARVQHFGTGHWTQNGKESDWEFYVESGDESRSTTFIYSVEDGLSKLTDTPFDTGRSTFEIINWTVDSTEAASIALDAIRDNEFPDFDGGLDPEILADENGNPYWTVDYSSRRKDGTYTLSIPLEYGDVEIDAKTGEIISTSGYT